MIRLIQRRLIIPRGDTGTFTVPVISAKNTGDVAVFSIIDNLTERKVFEKIVEVSGDTMTIEFSHNDTVNLPVGKYVWDIKFYSNPVFVDGALVDGVEVDSYYAAFTLPICEIRQTGDNLLMADDAPDTELTPSQLNILNATVNETNAAKRDAAASASAAEASATAAADSASDARTSANNAAVVALSAAANAANAATTKSQIDVLAAQVAADATTAVNAKNDAVASATDAGTSATAADASATTASNAATTATNKANEAYTSAGLAETAKVDAQSAASAASTSAASAQAAANEIKNISAEATTLQPDSNATATYNSSTGKLTFGIPRGNGITSAVMNNDYTLTLTYTNGNTFTTPPLKGEQGDAFHIVKTYNSIAAMNADYNGNEVEVGEFVMIASTVEDPDNAKVYVKGDQQYNFVIDMSGASGINGVGISSIQKTSTSGKVDTYTITYTDNTSTNFNVTNGENGSEYTVLVQSTQPTEDTNKLWIPTTNGVVQQVPTMEEMNAAIAGIDLSGYATKADTVLETTLSRGRKAGTTVGTGSFAFGNAVEASGTYSCAEGNGVIASGSNAHAEGNSTIASGSNAHAEGSSNVAYGASAHIEGVGGISSNIFITSTNDSKQYSVENMPAWMMTGVFIFNALDKNINAKVIAVDYGNSIITLNKTLGNVQHSQHNAYIGAAYELCSHTEGAMTIANGIAQHVQGTCNVVDTNNTYADIVGNGPIGFSGVRSNAYALTWTGDGKYAGDVYVGCNANSSGGTKLVKDMQVNGTSVVNDGVANIPLASSSTFGVVKTASTAGTQIVDSKISIYPASSAQIKSATGDYQPIVPSRQHYSVFYGLSKVAGVDLANETVTLGTYPATSKAAIQNMLGISDILAPTETTTASKAYGVGEVFTSNGKLYKVTTAIAQSEAIVTQDAGEIVSGHNVEEIKLSEYAVHDVQVNGTSVLQNGVANVPIAGNNILGAISVYGAGLSINNAGKLSINVATSGQVKSGTNASNPIVPDTQHQSTFYGLAKAAGDSTQSASNNTVGSYTDEAKGFIQHMLGTDTNLADYESDTTADQAYAIGELFMLNGKLHQATAAIAIGDTFTVGTNCAVVNAADVFPHDVQVNGTSVVQGGVANVPLSDYWSKEDMKVDTNWGIGINNAHYLYVKGAGDTYIKGGRSYGEAILPSNQHKSVFYGLAKIAGADEKDSALPAGQYTESAKSAISQMLNGPVTVSGTTPAITALPGVQYVCGEVATLDITLPASGCVDVVFESGSTATVLTITPPSGVTVKWANGFDPTSLGANMTYEINIMDGLGVSAAWT